MWVLEADQITGATEAHAMLQLCPYVRVSLQHVGAEEEDARGAHEVPAK